MYQTDSLGWPCTLYPVRRRGPNSPTLGQWPVLPTICGQEASSMQAGFTQRMGKEVISGSMWFPSSRKGEWCTWLWPQEPYSSRKFEIITPTAHILCTAGHTHYTWWCNVETDTVLTCSSCSAVPRFVNGEICDRNTDTYPLIVHMHRMIICSNNAWYKICIHKHLIDVPKQQTITCMKHIDHMLSRFAPVGHH